MNKSNVIGITVIVVLIGLFVWLAYFVITTQNQQDQQQQQQNHNNEMFIDQCIKAGKKVSSVSTGQYPNTESYLVCQ